MLAEARGERAQLGDGVGKIERTVAAKREDEAADLALLLDQQPLELVELGGERAGLGASLDRLDPERRAGEELDDAVVDIARERQARARGGAALDRLDQRVAVEDRGGDSPSSRPTSI